jgi:hypothetical protein
VSVKPRPIAERFWPKVDRNGPNGCWVWTGSLGAKGYGRIGSGARGAPTLLAHRVAWGFKHGPIPDGLFVCHKCDNPPCVNPEHLFLGTNRDNILDCMSKGRHVKSANTTCPQGHPFTPENTKRNRKGARRCTECRRLQGREYWYRRGGVPMALRRRKHGPTAAQSGHSIRVPIDSNALCTREPSTDT